MHKLYVAFLRCPIVVFTVLPNWRAALLGNTKLLLLHIASQPMCSSNSSPACVVVHGSLAVAIYAVTCKPALCNASACQRLGILCAAFCVLPQHIYQVHNNNHSLISVSLYLCHWSLHAHLQDHFWQYLTALSLLCQRKTYVRRHERRYH